MARFPFSPPISWGFGYICLHNSTELCNLLSTAFPYVMTTVFPRFPWLLREKYGKNATNKLLTAMRFCGKVSVTALMKTCRFAGCSERGSFWCKSSARPALPDTTSEPSVGNSRPGVPVTVPMSGSLPLQPGWNRGILCIPPLIFRGWVFLYLLPYQKGGNRYVRRKSVHL